MIIERLHNTLRAVTNPTDATSNSPFQRDGVKFLNMEPWVAYTFGSLFIAIGIACFFLYPRAKRKADAYRQEQLVEYNKQKKFKTNDYSRTGMFLPAWEKAKLFAPVFFGMVFCLIGIAWIVGNTLTTL